MEIEEKYLDFWFKLNTFLNRQKILSNKMHRQEELITVNLLAARSMIPPDVFQHVFIPLLKTLEERRDLLVEMSESSDDFMSHLQSFASELKGKLND